MGTKDWLAGWSPADARVLAETETSDVRAALVDTNGDGRELWFGVEVRGPSGAWSDALDWDDVSAHQPLGQVDGLQLVIGWGTGKSAERRVLEHDGTEYSVRVGRSGWYLVVAVVR